MDDVIRACRSANYQGFETIEPDGGTRREPKVIPGNGTLALTSSELRFVPWLPKKEFVIPLHAEALRSDPSRKRGGP